MSAAFIIVFRESFEAVLIVGILSAFLSQRQEGRRAFQWLGLGVGLGLALSLFTGVILWKVQELLEGNFLDWFQVIVMVTAMALIVHMCLWMKKNARGLRGELEKGATQALEKNYASLALLAGLAVLREGFETVLFLFGSVMEAEAKRELGALALTVVAGILASLVFWYLLQKGLRLLSYKTFFRITTAFLLITAGSLLLRVCGMLIQMEVLPPMKPAVWDTSDWMSGESVISRVLIELTGYQSSPALSTVLLYLAYWVIVLILFKKSAK